jgi:hypothetical protein
LVWLLLFAAAPCPAHPIDEYYLRFEVQVMLLTRGLRLDLFVLHGGLAAIESWRTWDPNQDLVLDDAEQQAWATALAKQVTVMVEGRPAGLEVEFRQFPEHLDFTTCAAPIVLRARVAAEPPAGRDIPCRVAVRPDPGYPVLARISFLAPRSVVLSPPQTATAAALATVRWPPGGEPDTRLPQLSLPAWFYEQPEDVGLQPLPPSAPTDRSPVAWAPSAELRCGSSWPALGLALLAIAAALGVARRRRVGVK